MSQALYENAAFRLSGPVHSVHTFVDFSNVVLTVNGREVCVTVAVEWLYTTGYRQFA